MLSVSQVGSAPATVSTGAWRVLATRPHLGHSEEQLGAPDRVTSSRQPVTSSARKHLKCATLVYCSDDILMCVKNPTSVRILLFFFFSRIKVLSNHLGIPSELFSSRSGWFCTDTVSTSPRTTSLGKGSTHAHTHTCRHTDVAKN